MDEVRIARVEWGRLAGLRPREAGRNARLDEHGDSVSVSIARLTADDGSTGFGACYPTPELLRSLPGTRLGDAFSFQRGVADEWLPVEYPLWDLMAKRAGVPVYQLAAEISGVCPPPPRPHCRSRIIWSYLLTCAETFKAGYSRSCPAVCARRSPQPHGPDRALVGPTRRLAPAHRASMSAQRAMCISAVRPCT